MAEPFVGEIKMFAGQFVIYGWAYCNGQFMDISQNETLYNLIGTTYGGDGQQTFALPDLRSRVPIHVGSNGVNTYVIGQNGGYETVTLAAAQTPQHTHTAVCSSTPGVSSAPLGNVWAQNPASKQYGDPSLINGQTANTVVSTAGSNLPHDNMMPYLAVNFLISLYGVYPTQS